LVEVSEKFQRYLTTSERAPIPKGFSVIADKAFYCHGFVTQLARVVASDADATKVSLQWPRPKIIGDVLPCGVEGALAFASRALASGENRRHDFAAAVEVADENEVTTGYGLEVPSVTPVEIPPWNKTARFDQRNRRTSPKASSVKHRKSAN
jgi:hypothetical protein